MGDTGSTINVYIVDDHPVVRLGLRTMLDSEAKISVVGVSGTAREAIPEIQRLKPDVVLMDLRMPEMDGAEAITQLRRVEPSVRVLVLTNYEADHDISQALQAGALGYLLKSTPQEEIVRAVEMVSRSERCVPPRIAQRLVEAVGREALSQRELEVLTLVAKGMTNKEIAGKLFISDKTVRNHVANCLEKLDVGDRTEATTTALMRGLIRLAD